MEHKQGKLVILITYDHSFIVYEWYRSVDLTYNWHWYRCARWNLHRFPVGIGSLRSLRIITTKYSNLGFHTPLHTQTHGHSLPLHGCVRSSTRVYAIGKFLLDGLHKRSHKLSCISLNQWPLFSPTNNNNISFFLDELSFMTTFLHSIFHITSCLNNMNMLLNVE